MDDTNDPKTARTFTVVDRRSSSATIRNGPWTTVISTEAIGSPFEAAGVAPSEGAMASTIDAVETVADAVPRPLTSADDAAVARALYGEVVRDVIEPAHGPVWYVSPRELESLKQAYGDAEVQAALDAGHVARTRPVPEGFTDKVTPANVRSFNDGGAGTLRNEQNSYPCASCGGWFTVHLDGSVTRTALFGVACVCAHPKRPATDLPKTARISDVTFNEYSPVNVGADMGAMLRAHKAKASHPDLVGVPLTENVGMNRAERRRHESRARRTLRSFAKHGPSTDDVKAAKERAKRGKDTTQAE